ncbi:MAG: Protoheme IX farnesyltransferase 1 [Myxococcota bacterium]|nr:Protoheme IX farnesyltransferase 1 [Myxococcota bacterium]
MSRHRHQRIAASDFAALSKPRIVIMTLIMTAGGMWLAAPHQHLDGTLWLASLLGVGLAVACANAINMILERDVDPLMERTRNRPLAARRMGVGPAAAFSALTGLAGLAVLAAWVNPLTAGLTLFSIASYAFIYTPLKRVTPHALLVGAVPGAMPPLLGWTAVANSLDAPGLVLFLILFLWQIPHFLAISIFRKEEYARAGIRVTPLVKGENVARTLAIAYSTALIPASLLLTGLGATGWCYSGFAVLAGVIYLIANFRGFQPGAGFQGARQAFVTSLLYLPVLVAGLVVDAFIHR